MASFAGAKLVKEFYLGKKYFREQEQEIGNRVDFFLPAKESLTETGGVMWSQ